MVVWERLKERNGLCFVIMDASCWFRLPRPIDDGMLSRSSTSEDGQSRMFLHKERLVLSAGIWAAQTATQCAGA
jgi:hypothetical protein